MICSDPEAPEAGSDLRITTSTCVDNRIAIGVVTGTIGIEGLKRGARSIWQSPGWLGRAIVWGMRQARFDLDRKDIEDFAHFIHGQQPDPPPRRIAFVAATDLEFGLSRVFQAFRETSETDFEVFRDYDVALAWAGNAEAR